MKSILEFINEAISREAMKNYIYSLLNNDDIDDKSLTKAYDIMAKATGGALSMAEPNEDKSNLFKNSREIDKQYKKIKRLFREYDLLNVLYKIINDSSVLPTASEVFNNYSGNIIDFYTSYKFQLNDDENIQLPSDLIKELALEYAEKDSHGVDRGDFEVLCCLLLKDLNENNNPSPGHFKGDINTETMGSIEFKSAGGRLMGQSINSPELIDKTVESVLIEKHYNFDKKILEKINGNNKGLFSKESQIKELLTYLINDLNITEEDIIELLAKSISAQFVELRTESEIEQIKSIIKTNKIYKVNNYKLISRLLGCIDLYFYHKLEKIDYMIVFNDKKNGDYIKLGKSILTNLQELYNNKDITFSALPRNSKNNREAVMQIHYKK